jgi:hypothetical protein
MAYAQPSASFLHATLYSSLLLQVSRELFPGLRPMPHPLRLHRDVDRARDAAAADPGAADSDNSAVF